MPPRSTPPPRSHDPSGYRDLLLFEERLKSNAASLQKRKSRYQLFLVQLLMIIAFLLWEVLMPLQSSILAIPYNALLQRLLPDMYRPEQPVTLHPYFTSGLLFVSVTTLVLFFASGMYSEKIAYANKYVPHANRALRSFNMYLNVRRPPLRSQFYFNPISFFFPRHEETSSRSSPSSTSPRSSRASSPNPSSGDESPQTRRRSPSVGKAIPISPIPPSSNPRGELIFSSKVDKNFRESYERYRAAFERRREEVNYLQKSAKWWSKLMFWWKPPPPPPPQHTRTTSLSGTSSRRISRAGTPPNSDISRSGSPSRPRSGRRVTPTRDETGAGGSPSKIRRGDTDEDMRTIALERSLGLASSS